jgi:hypothetical protein
VNVIQIRLAGKDLAVQVLAPPIENRTQELQHRGVDGLSPEFGNENQVRLQLVDRMGAAIWVQASHRNTMSPQRLWIIKGLSTPYPFRARAS